MRKFRLALIFVVSALAAGQSRISPRIGRSGGSTYVIVFRDGADMDRARDAISRRGFDILTHPDLLPNHVLAGGPRSRLNTLEELDDIAYVAPASTDLATGRRVRACPGAVAHYLLNGHGWPADGNGVVALNYAFASLPSTLDANTARTEIERALNEWERYANFTLAAGAEPDGLRTLAIRFVRGAHGDAYPFDGRGGMLAHTFYPAPLNDEPLAGDLHFDADEDWRVGVTVDLFTVALHEAGHALGLAHSDQPGAVMYPYYRQAYALTSDDITAIQELYGVRGGVSAAPAPDPPPTAAPPVSAPPTLPVNLPPPVVPVPSADHTPPVIRIATPSTPILSTSAASVTVAGAASDDTGVVVVRWSTSTGDAGEASGTVSWSASIPLYPGSTVVTVRAYDAAGNSGWRSITVLRR